MLRLNLLKNRQQLPGKVIPNPEGEVSFDTTPYLTRLREWRRNQLHDWEHDIVADTLYWLDVEREHLDLTIRAQTLSQMEFE